MKTIGQDSFDPQINVVFLSMIFCWVLLIGALAGWNYWQSYSVLFKSAQASARESYNKDLVYRRWATMHGGIYVPITPVTPPNPHLAHIPERDISTPSGKKLTLINPAYMTRQVHELGIKYYAVPQGHITSLKPIRPENVPDEWERRALQAFEQGQQEVSSLAPLGKETYLRFMSPLITEAGCLKCHGAQGYKVGDIRGGISVAVPWGPFRGALSSELRVITLAYGGILMIGIMGLNLGRKRLQSHLSERKQAEEALMQSENRMSLAMKAGNMGLYDLNVKTGETVVNPGYALVLGYDPVEFHETNAKWIERMHPDDREPVAAVYKAYVNGEIPEYKVEFRQKTKDGNWKWILSLGKIMERDADGNPQRMLGMHVDISERKLAEKEREQFFKFFQTSADLMCIADPNGAFMKTNPACTETLGYSEAELIAKPFIEFVHPDDKQATLDEMVRQLQRGFSLNFENRYICKDGSVKWLSWRSIYNKDEGITYATARDITEQQRADEARRESENWHRTILRTAMDGVWIVDMQGRLLEVNDAYCRMSGYSEQELLTMSISGLEDVEAPTDTATHMQRVLTQGEDRFETCHLRKDKSRFDVEISAQYRSTDGGRMVAFLRDITERKQAEEALRRSEADLKEAQRVGRLGSWEWDATNDTITWSEEYCHIFGFAPTQRPPGYKGHLKAYTPESAARLAAAVEKNIQTGETYELDLELARTEGPRRWITARSETKRDAQDKIVGLRGTVQDITERKRAEEQLQDTLGLLRKAVNTTIQVMVSAVETRDPYTAGHQLRSADLAGAIATEVGLSQDKIEGIRIAGSIHDIGKLSIPAEILSKPKKLSELEFALIKEHARQGYEILKNVESSWPLAEMVHQHHERMNGSGYPRKLKGEDILMEARILAVADVVESMASHRPYRPALGIDAALAEIENNRGTLYDNTVADACLRLFRGKGFKLARI